MSKISVFFNLFFLVGTFGGVCAAQRGDKVEVTAKIFAGFTEQECTELKAGRAVNLPKPKYPHQAQTARIGGTVLITAALDEKGKFKEIRDVSGNSILQSAVDNAVRKVKFSPTVCDGEVIAANVVLTYNFIPYINADRYFNASRIGDFTDLKNDSPFYQAVLELCEMHQLAFGYADKKFYADAPLTRGDLAHFLRLTLDLLSSRAAAADKLPREINLYAAHNPLKLLSLDGAKTLKSNEPFYDSTRTLLLKYDIALTDDKGDFQGGRYLNGNEVIYLWAKIFGAEAIPVNFVKTEDGDRIISRGEFALFLQESLQVLIYKVLP